MAAGHAFVMRALSSNTSPKQIAPAIAAFRLSGGNAAGVVTIARDRPRSKSAARKPSALQTTNSNKPDVDRAGGGPRLHAAAEQHGGGENTCRQRQPVSTRKTQHTASVIGGPASSTAPRHTPTYCCCAATPGSGWAEIRKESPEVLSTSET